MGYQFQYPSTPEENFYALSSGVIVCLLAIKRWRRMRNKMKKELLSENSSARIDYLKKEISDLNECIVCMLVFAGLFELFGVIPLVIR